ncbi:MAG: hypothetical protein HY093_04035 [Candidatus Liptonbacteria bacterium]|nr:hypothetical protein [Candidatus Liptonbacteria bacterium]
MALDWTTIYKKYKGLWIVLLDDEKTVVGSGRTLKEAIQQATKRGCKNPIVTRVPEELTAYVGWGL